MSIPKQYRVGRASFVQDELFMKLVLYVLRVDELSQDELFIQLVLLIRTTLMDESRVVFWHHQPCHQLIV